MLDRGELLDAVRVLDVIEEETGDCPTADRAYWEVRGSKASLELMDDVLSLLPKDSDPPRIKYNRGHVAVGTTGIAFLWFHLRKAGHIHFHIRTGAEARGDMQGRLEMAGIECGPRAAEEMRYILTRNQFEDNKHLISELVTLAEMRSRG